MAISWTTTEQKDGGAARDDRRDDDDAPRCTGDPSMADKLADRSPKIIDWTAQNQNSFEIRSIFH